MTPAETTAILRQFNEWRRGDEDVPQPDPREIGEAIDAAVEMIERLEAAEKEVESWKGLSKQFGNEADALRAKIGRMEKRLRLILEEPENTLSNSKAMREMIKQARLALEESK